MTFPNQAAFVIRKNYLAWAFLLLLIEICIASFVHDTFIRPWGGDFLVVILLYCMLRGVTNFRVRKAAVSVLLFSFLIEILQFFHLANLLGLESNTVARTLIGTHFSWSDMLAYTLGILFVLIIEDKFGKGVT